MKPWLTQVNATEARSGTDSYTGVYVICLTWSPRHIPMLPHITIHALQRGSTLL